VKSVEESVKEFHAKYGHLINKLPTIYIPENVKDLRKKLITEEYCEVIKAFGDNDIVEIADGLADLVYVAIGTAISYGIPFDRIFHEVHLSNMTKTPSKAYEGQKYGEVNPKGPDFKRPEIGQILRYPLMPTKLEKLEDALDSEKIS
jgi:predicted HAD superfamily Cof-like phosphohydrolase